MHLLLVRIDWAREAEVVMDMERATRPLVERLHRAEERLLEEVHARGVPPEPSPAADAPTDDPPEREVEPMAELSPEESLRQLARIAAESRRVAAAVADIVVREVYPEGAPRTVSLVDLTHAIDARLGTEMPRETLESITECDALVRPEDPDTPFSVHDLFERIASSIEGAHARLAADDEESRRQLAFPVLLRARLLALHLAGAAQLLGHPTVVAGLAVALGIDPAPGVEPLGSA